MRRRNYTREIKVAAAQNIKERDYWLEKLSGEPVKSFFPYDRNGAVGAESGKRMLGFSFDPVLSSRLMELGNRSFHTLHVILAAALAALLARYTADRDILLGTPIYREETDAETGTELINTVLILRNQLNDNMTFKELLLQVKQTVVEAVEHQAYPVELLEEKLNNFSLFDVALLLSDIHDKEYLEHVKPAVIFSFRVVDEHIDGEVEYDSGRYRETTLDRIVCHFIRLLSFVLDNIDGRLGNIEILSAVEKKQLLVDFNDTAAAYPRDKTLPQLLVEQVEKTPHHIALRYEDRCLTYKELDKKADQLANYLYAGMNLRLGEPVGLMMDRSLYLPVSILGILKAGGAYVPMDTSFPEERIKVMIDDASIKVLISLKRYIKTLNRLQWECSSFQTFICLDSEDIYGEEEVEKNELMGKKLWDYVGEAAVDEITGGGWASSYTGDPISEKEMAEYGDNILKKLTPLLHKDMKILEIGCASGISMYRIAPCVGLYYGTDLSEVIVRKNEERIREEGHKNIILSCLPAHEIDTLPAKDFDLVIINSVIQYFHGHNYLREIIRKVIGKMAENGWLFIGDVMNLDLKGSLIRDLWEFKQAHRDDGEQKYNTKTDWSVELFVSPAFFEDLMWDMPQIRDVKFSDKIHTIENELTKFRYDVLLTVDKKLPAVKRSGNRQKYQHDLSILRRYGITPVNPGLIPGGLAYIIYTSGSTGKPKGAAVEHRSAVNLLFSLFEEYPLSGGDSYLLKTSLIFDVSVSELFGWILGGGKLVVLGKDDQADPQKILEITEGERITHINFVPSMFNVFLDQLNDGNMAKLSSLKYIFLAGETLHPHQVNKFRRLHTNIQLENLYGPTEATVYSGKYPLSHWIDGGTVPIGKPLQNVKLYVLDKNDGLLPLGVPGELCIAGSGLARGYLNNPELTAEKFKRIRLFDMSPFSYIYRTGDLARWLPDGNLEFLGRVDFQVKIRGIRVEPGEIENRLSRYEKIKEAVVISKRDDKGDHYLCAYVTGVDAGGTASSFDVDLLREHLSLKLPYYMIPSYFVILASIPLTPNGKIDRKSLPDPEVGAGIKYTPPGDEVEDKLTGIWAHVLGIEKSRIGIEDNFFRLGGHSLKGIFCLSEIHKAFDVRLNLTDIFKLPTVKVLASYIRNAAANRFESIEVAENKEFYALSSAQKRLYVIQQMYPHTITYNIPCVVELDSRFDREKIETIFNKLVERHESLRTSFELVERNPVQKIYSPREVEFAVEYYELTGREEYEDVINRFIRPFELVKAPLLRVGFVKNKDNRNILMVDMHHIVSDAVSMGILTGEFMRLNNGETLSPLKFRYRDFSEWQISRVESGQMKEQEDYWLEQFEGRLPVLDIPMDFERPRVQSFEGDSVTFVISGHHAEKLRAIARRENATMFMVMLAVFNFLLAKLCGREDIVVGTAVAGRRHKDLEQIIGMFVNTLALRNDLEEHKTFIRFLKEVKERTLEAFDNQDYPFEDLVEKIMEERDPARNPLFDILFSFTAHEPGEVPGGQGEVSDPGAGIEQSKFDIMLAGKDTGKHLEMVMVYAVKLFKRETIERYIDYFREIVDAVAGDESLRLRDINIAANLPAARKDTFRASESEFEF